LIEETEKVAEVCYVDLIFKMRVAFWECVDIHLIQFWLTQFLCKWFWRTEPNLSVVQFSLVYAPWTPLSNGIVNFKVLYRNILFEYAMCYSYLCIQKMIFYSFSLGYIWLGGLKLEFINLLSWIVMWLFFCYDPSWIQPNHCYVMHWCYIFENCQILL
jgi:hypothetical protein